MDSSVKENKFLIWSNTPEYVAGFDLGVRPIGDWSISMSLSIFSKPETLLWSPGIIKFLENSFCIDFDKISVINVDLPEPDTPVTDMNLPKGKFTV